MPMRPDATAARMSRSDRTTTAKYGLLSVREREHRAAQPGPGAGDVARGLESRARVAPGHLDRAHPRGARHVDVRGRVADDDGLRGAHAETRRSREREIGRGLVLLDRVPTEVGVDLVLDAQPAQDALAVLGTLPRDRRLLQPSRVERVQ